jgi:hypothetical protein
MFGMFVVKGLYLVRCKVQLYDTLRKLITKALAFSTLSLSAARQGGAMDYFKRAARAVRFLLGLLCFGMR